MLNRLLNRLHSVFNKDPRKVNVLSIAYSGGSCVVTVGKLTLTAVTTGGTVTVDLSTITVSQLVTALNGETDFTATLVNAAYGDYLARGIFENKAQDITLDPILYYPTSLLWAEMRTHEFALTEAADNVALAEKQMHLDKASGSWLDEWGKDWFDIERESGETDINYLARLVIEVGRVRLNNMSLAIMMEDLLGFDVDVNDIGYYAQKEFLSDFFHSTTDTLEDVLFDDNVNVAIVVSGLGIYFSQDISGLPTATKNIIKSIINRNKASGKVVKYYIPDGEAWQEIIL